MVVFFKYRLPASACFFIWWIFLVPACILLFLGIWIEKGMGLIAPGLVPSPMGEILDYAPSWVEVSVTLGILALGVFVVTTLVKPALKIEQRFEYHNTRIAK